MVSFISLSDFSWSPIHFPLAPVSTVNDAIQIMAALATILALFVALSSYQHSSREARMAHMHRLFADYLKMRVDLATATKKDSAIIEKPIIENYDFLTVKVYTMEEVLLWLRREYPLLSRKFRLVARVLDIFGGGRVSNYDSWNSTIQFHLQHEPHATIAYLKEYRQSVSDIMWAYCAAALPELKEG